MYFISAASSISHQPSFKNAGFSKSISALQSDSVLIAPNFKDYIQPTAIRRMSEILRTAITCSIDCLAQANITQPDAIVVATGLGCLFETEKFLQNFIGNENGLISPTAFIQSTHNTVGGQLSILLGNHNYNMTHSQNALSFEHCIIDAQLCIDEGSNHVLAGAADEHIKLLDEVAVKLGFTKLHLTSGSSFFVVSKTVSEKSIAKIRPVATYAFATSFLETILEFLNEHQTQPAQIDCIVFASYNSQNEKHLETIFKSTKLIDYKKYAGDYFTNAAFALHFAIDTLQYNPNTIKRILICNNLQASNIGLTIVESIEA